MRAVKILVFAAACLALAVGCGGKASHKVYAERMNSQNVEERRAAAKEMRAKSRDPKLAPILVQAARDPDADVRVYALYAIGRADPREEGIVAAVVAGMGDESVEVRRAAASAVGEMNPFPSACIPAMIRMLVDPDDRVRQLTVTTFIDLEGVGVSTLARQLVNARDDALRVAIINVLGRIGPAAKSALPDIGKVAGESENDEVKSAAENAVKRIGG